ncbi:hypothetical protein CDAR_310141 [Caerostris darwini]|uniref:Uncharacterized protein n=1 Tax=Caerostris darwini TaxID=1538125 RepID=A0AAV4WRK5_9ARAC|nr:hypothetical protein CDAR_310141 [Caerostris darwini]
MQRVYALPWKQYRQKYKTAPSLIGTLATYPTEVRVLPLTPGGTAWEPGENNKKNVEQELNQRCEPTFDWSTTLFLFHGQQVLERNSTTDGIE